mmetsp:Transcript_9861/g.14999  ORF Transcript_9861/g.14999 Transcript_9861/m.14999 type:complete len:204 (-) Transcript_9861:85-696(-)
MTMVASSNGNQSISSRSDVLNGLISWNQDSSSKMVQDSEFTFSQFEEVFDVVESFGIHESKWERWVIRFCERHGFEDIVKNALLDAEWFETTKRIVLNLKWKNQNTGQFMMARIVVNHVGEKLDYMMKYYACSFALTKKVTHTVTKTNKVGILWGLIQDKQKVTCTYVEYVPQMLSETTKKELEGYFIRKAIEHDNVAKAIQI